MTTRRNNILPKAKPAPQGTGGDTSMNPIIEIVANYYRGLVAQGLPHQIAIALTTEFQSLMLQKAFDAQALTQASANVTAVEFDVEPPKDPVSLKGPFPIH